MTQYKYTSQKWAIRSKNRLSKDTTGAPLWLGRLFISISGCPARNHSFLLLCKGAFVTRIPHSMHLLFRPHQTQFEICRSGFDFLWLRWSRVNVKHRLFVDIIVLSGLVLAWLAASTLHFRLKWGQSLLSILLLWDFHTWVWLGQIYLKSFIGVVLQKFALMGSFLSWCTS